MVTIDAIQQKRSCTERRGAGAIADALLRWMIIAAERRRSRRALLVMTDDQLRDIGVSRGEARREALRPFWD